MNTIKLTRIKEVQSNNKVTWDMIFVQPVARLILYLIIDFRFITPNVCTTISNLFLLASVSIIYFFDYNYYLISVVSLLISQLFDHMDGAVARYKGISTSFGSFYDKISDGIGFILLFLTIGYIEYLETNSPIYIILMGAGSYFKLMMGYSKFVTNDLTNDKIKKTIDPQNNFRFNLKKINSWFRFLWTCLYRLYTFDEADLYFWVSLFLLINRLDILCYIICISQFLAMGSMIIRRASTLKYYDKLK